MKTKVISLFSTKGGVGKTLLAVNIAVGLALNKKKTIFLDFDIGAPQATASLLGLNVRHSLADLINHLDKFSTQERQLENYLSFHQASGLAFLPAITNLRQKIRPHQIKTFLNFLEERYEFIIIDSGSNLTDNLIATFESSNLIILVLTPDIVSIYQTEWLLDTLQEMGFPLRMIKAIINRAESKGSVSLQEVKLLFPCEFIAQIPSEGKVVGLSVNRKIPVIIDVPNAKISLAIKKLCEDLIKKESLYIEHKELSQIRLSREVPRVESFWQELGLLEREEELFKEKLSEEEDKIIQLKKRIHRRLIDEMDLKRLRIEEIVNNPARSRELKLKAEKIITNIIAEEAGGFITSGEVRRKIIKEILEEALGLGPLEDLLKDPTITEIMVNNKDQVYVEREGKIELTSKRFTSNEQVRVIIERILAPLGRRIDESSPYVDARLPDGSRVNAIIHPLSLTGPTLTIRKFSKRKLTIDVIRKNVKQSGLSGGSSS